MEHDFINTLIISLHKSEEPITLLNEITTIFNEKPDKHNYILKDNYIPIENKVIFSSATPIYSNFDILK